MGVVEGCRFETERLLVASWHGEPDDDRLAAFLVTMLTPAVTSGLPPEWAGPYDGERAAAWIRERDAESTVLLVKERVAGTPLGLLIVASEESVRTPTDLLIGYVLAEDRWGRGLGGELVGGFVAWARAHGGICSVSAGVAADNPASARVLAEHGFEPFDAGRTSEQTYRLDLLPELDITIRAETCADHDAIRALVAAAFGSPAEADLVERIRASTHYRPELALVAEVAGEVAGHVMISGATVHDGVGERPIVMLSPLAVAPERQRRGIGGSLVRAAVGRAEIAGEAYVVVEGDPAYYSQFGFEAARPHGLTLPLPDWAPSEAGQLLRLGGSGEPTGPPRGQVIYPEAFDGLDD